MKTGSYRISPAQGNFASVLNERKRALIVDDEKDICYLLGNILRQKNIQTAFAGSLAEAESILQSSSPFYFVFLDNHLPDGFGVDQIKSWKQRFPTVRFIMNTAHDSGEEQLKAENGGAEFFIGKPFSKEIILKAIGEA